MGLIVSDDEAAVVVVIVVVVDTVWAAALAVVVEVRTTGEAIEFLAPGPRNRSEAEPYAIPSVPAAVMAPAQARKLRLESFFCLGPSPVDTKGTG
jgi:hypothetical protein